MDTNLTNKLCNKIQYIGCDDASLDLFESQYSLPNGMCYNSYLLLGERVAVMDSVDKRKTAEWLQKIEQSQRTPDYLIIQHTEPDHSGSIGAFLEKYPHATIVASRAALQFLEQFGYQSAHTLMVKQGDGLDLGGLTLHFISAPMVHWPDVLMTYLPEEKTLFSADAFGSFGVYSPFSEHWIDEALRYYINICGKYGQPVQALLKKVGTLDVQRICPLHGPVLTENLAHYIGLYDTWSRYEAESEGVLIAYASIHGSTATAASILASMIESKGVEVKLMDLCRTDMSTAVAEAFRMKRMVLAASSYDGGLFTPMYDFLHRIQIKGYKGRRVALIENGSWAPSAGRVMKQMLAEMKDIDLVEPMVTLRSTLQPTDMPAMEALAAAII